MGNTFHYNARPDLEEIDMSNGLTSVFVAVLSMAMSSVSTENWQKRFAVCIASQDQWVIGSGTILFDIGSLPWSKQNLEEERSFMLRAIDAALDKTGWDRLSYKPREETVNECLLQLKVLITAFSAEHIAPSVSAMGTAGKPEHFDFCARHGVYKHNYGCIVCND